MSNTDSENLRRWRLILGGDEADGTDCQLQGLDAQMDASLSALYEFERKQRFEYIEKDNSKVGRGQSQPDIARWLGDIRNYFPQSVVQVIQGDALKQPMLQKKLMLEPEILEQATPNVALVVNLMELGKLIPSKTKDTARRVVQKVVEELIQKLEQKNGSGHYGGVESKQSQQTSSLQRNRLEYHHSQKSKTLSS